MPGQRQKLWLCLGLMVVGIGLIVWFLAPTTTEPLQPSETKRPLSDPKATNNIPMH